ncbi:hypothetical protein [Maribacter luteus]|uniref:hypothetical protein n=1 Tax=Maribacter luteus TaxID=2594478 RepID=UPI00249279EC|nr:hypothetical protein [Maribacter luteus]|tara:strand:- start:817 stop:1203 length:387 start_codon:yes stop_codon:yes gene_type:complete
MPVELTPRLQKDHLKIVLTGQRTLGQEGQEGIRIWTEITRLCEASNMNRILVRSKIEGRIPPSSMFEVAEAIDKLSFGKDFKIAGVGSNQIEYANLTFFENCASRLNYKIKLFLSESEALKWLLKKSH